MKQITINTTKYKSTIYNSLDKNKEFIKLKSLLKINNQINSFDLKNDNSIFNNFYYIQKYKNNKNNLFFTFNYITEQDLKYSSNITNLLIKEVNYNIENIDKLNYTEEEKKYLKLYYFSYFLYNIKKPLEIQDSQLKYFRFVFNNNLSQESVDLFLKSLNGIDYFKINEIEDGLILKEDFNEKLSYINNLIKSYPKEIEFNFFIDYLKNLEEGKEELNYIELMNKDSFKKEFDNFDISNKIKLLDILYSKNEEYLKLIKNEENYFYLMNFIYNKIKENDNDYQQVSLKNVFNFLLKKEIFSINFITNLDINEKIKILSILMPNVSYSINKIIFNNILEDKNITKENICYLKENHKFFEKDELRKIFLIGETNEDYKELNLELLKNSKFSFLDFNEINILDYLPNNKNRLIENYQSSSFIESMCNLKINIFHLFEKQNIINFITEKSLNREMLKYLIKQKIIDNLTKEEQIKFFKNNLLEYSRTFYNYQELEIKLFDLGNVSLLKSFYQLNSSVRLEESKQNIFFFKSITENKITEKMLNKLISYNEKEINEILCENPELINKIIYKKDIDQDKLKEFLISYNKYVKINNSNIVNILSKKEFFYQFFTKIENEKSIDLFKELLNYTKNDNRAFYENIDFYKLLIYYYKNPNNHKHLGSNIVYSIPALDNLFKTQNIKKENFATFLEKMLLDYNLKNNEKIIANNNNVKEKVNKI